MNMSPTPSGPSRALDGLCSAPRDRGIVGILEGGAGFVAVLPRDDRLESGPRRPQHLVSRHQATRALRSLGNRPVSGSQAPDQGHASRPFAPPWARGSTPLLPSTVAAVYFGGGLRVGAAHLRLAPGLPWWLTPFQARRPSSVRRAVRAMAALSAAFSLSHPRLSQQSGSWCVTGPRQQQLSAFGY